mgnify:CR=1 FL=1|tara:strand:- start:130 stop:333 length:204 start_codon:yes stop_codon:yes gene_type:complete
MIEDIDKIEKANMYGPDKFIAHMMYAIQQKVKEVRSNEDFKDWSTEFIISTCSVHGEKEKKLFGTGL